MLSLNQVMMQILAFRLLSGKKVNVITSSSVGMVLPLAIFITGTAPLTGEGT